MKIVLSKKQNKLRELIVSPNVPEIDILGSTQSGKTYVGNLSISEYARNLYEYDPVNKFKGAIIGWTTDTLKRNVVDDMVAMLEELGFKRTTGRKKGDFTFNWGQSEKSLEIYNLKIFFFSFDNYQAFNRILGSPLIFIWVDEAARIYSQPKLQEQFDQLYGRLISYTGHPYKKYIRTYNVEGGANHPYKVRYLDNKECAKLVFYPYDNPKLDTEEKIREVANSFPTKTLKLQKIYNEWVVSEGKVFNKVNKITTHEIPDYYRIREIGIGIDYGSTNPTAFVPWALAENVKTRRWCLIRLQTYHHSPAKLGTTPTTEYFSEQLRRFIVYLKQKYGNYLIQDIVVDSEAKHFINRLDADNIPNIEADKYPGSVKEGVEYMQSMFEKDFLLILEEPSVTNIHEDLTVDLSAIDESLEEFNSYQYDKIKSIKTGIDCYVKDLDHSIDASRYLFIDWKSKDKAPVI